MSPPCSKIVSIERKVLNREEGGNGHLLEGGKGLCVRGKEGGNGHVLKGQTIDSYTEFMNIRFLNWTTHNISQMWFISLAAAALSKENH